MKLILGKKIEMTQNFDKEGNVVPATLIAAGSCYVTQIKTKEKDGYQAIQIGLENLKKTEGKSSVSNGARKKIKKSQEKKPFRYLREFRYQETPKEAKELKAGDKIDVSVFQEGDRVKISGVSKGKGFAGAVKRWGFHGRPASHGTKHEERKMGSTGSRFPQRTVKGRRMAGRMGSERVTIENLEIIKIDKENNLLAVRGAVPGKRGTLLEIRSE